MGLVGNYILPAFDGFLDDIWNMLSSIGFKKGRKKRYFIRCRCGRSIYLCHKNQAFMDR